MVMGIMWQCPKCGRDFTKPNQSHSCGTTLSGIDEYISAQPKEIQVLLKKIRQTIRKAAPDAIEKISWRMPTFWQGENLIHFAAFRKHIGVYPGDLGNIPFEQRLAGYKKTKGAIQFPLDKPMDYDLISDIARFRVSMVSGKKSKVKA
jgi:uncharacterized protein YdhG (YjbR/CyaY superfamily)